MGKFIKYQLPACLWAVIIFISSSLPRLRTPDVGLSFADKIIHFAVYLILGLLLARAFQPARAQGRERRAFITAAALGVFWGLADEIHQAFVPGRIASLYDFAADAFGVLFALGVIWWRGRRVS